MALLPGQPINTSGVHPLVQIGMEGVRNFSVGPRLAAAQIAQNQQGVSSFLSNAVRQSISRQQQELEERKLQINTGLKMQEMDMRQKEAAANRSFRERQLASSERIAGARLGLASRQANSAIALNEEKILELRAERERADSMGAFVAGFFDDPTGASAEATPISEPAATGLTSPLFPALVPYPVRPTPLDLEVEAIDQQLKTSPVDPASPDNHYDALFARQQMLTMAQAKVNYAEGKYSTAMHYLAQENKMRLDAALMKTTEGEAKAAIPRAMAALNPYQSAPLDKSLPPSMAQAKLVANNPAWRVASLPASIMMQHIREQDMGRDRLTSVRSVLDRMIFDMEGQKLGEIADTRASGDEGLGSHVGRYFDSHMEDYRNRLKQLDEHIATKTLPSLNSLDSSEQLKDRLDRQQKAFDDAESKAAEYGFHPDGEHKPGRITAWQKEIDYLKNKMGESGGSRESRTRLNTLRSSLNRAIVEGKTNHEIMKKLESDIDATKHKLRGKISPREFGEVIESVSGGQPEKAVEALNQRRVAIIEAIKINPDPNQLAALKAELNSIETELAERGVEGQLTGANRMGIPGPPIRSSNSARRVGAAWADENL